jgi:hypothetical protein
MPQWCLRSCSEAAAAARCSAQIHPFIDVPMSQTSLPKSSKAGKLLLPQMAAQNGAVISLVLMTMTTMMFTSMTTTATTMMTA